MGNNPYFYYNECMDISILFLLIVGGFLMSFINCTVYVKALKNQTKTSDIVSLVIGAIFGGPAMLFFYIYSEVRDEDFTHHYRFLILSIIYTIVEIIVIILLFSFNLVKLN